VRVLILTLSIVMMTLPLLFSTWGTPPAYAFDRKECLENCRDWFEDDCSARWLWLTCIEDCERKFWRAFDREFKDSTGKENDRPQ
jgi:hypothetical protein